jgi:hypothetical protein
MMLDSVIYVGLTRPEAFKISLTGHIIFKTSLILLLVFPLAFFVRRFRKRDNLSRGSLDIFKKLENLEKDLEKAHNELKAYAQNLEKMVEDRTSFGRRARAAHPKPKPPAVPALTSSRIQFHDQWLQGKRCRCVCPHPPPIKVETNSTLLH